MKDADTEIFCICVIDSVHSLDSMQIERHGLTSNVIVASTKQRWRSTASQELKLEAKQQATDAAAAAAAAARADAALSGKRREPVIVNRAAFSCCTAAKPY